MNRRSSSPKEKGSPVGEPFVHPRPNPTVPSGHAEELALARLAVAEYEELARGLWSERYYARARHYFALAAAERAHVLALEARPSTPPPAASRRRKM